MTFPGESLAVATYGNTTGSALWSADAVSYRAEVSTFTSGDESFVNVPLSPWLLAPGDEAEVSWVVEVAAGSGTFDLSEGAGPLGSHAVTAGTLVVPSMLTAADVLAGGTATLTIACTAGTVDVQQVKLRVWPPGGALGGLSEPYQPDAVSISATMRVAPMFYEMPDYVTGASLAVVMDAAQVELRGEFDATPIGDPSLLSTSTPVGASFYALAEEFTASTPPARGSGNIGGGLAYLERGAPFVPDPPGDYGIDWIYPPNEVPGDPDGWTYTGEGVWGWWQPVVTVQLTEDTVGPPQGNFRVGADNVTGFDSPTATFGDITDTATLVGGVPADDYTPSLDHDVTLPDPDQDGLVRLAFWHDGGKAPVAIGYTGTGAGLVWETTGNAQAAIYAGRWVDGVFWPLLFSYTAGAYRYWTLTPATVTKLRQYHRDDGLGVAPRRAYGGGSRTNTRRAFGYT